MQMRIPMICRGSSHRHQTKSPSTPLVTSLIAGRAAQGKSLTPVSHEAVFKRCLQFTKRIRHTSFQQYDVVLSQVNPLRYRNQETTITLPIKRTTTIGKSVIDAVHLHEILLFQQSPCSLWWPKRKPRADLRRPLTHARFSIAGMQLKVWHGHKRNVRRQQRTKQSGVLFLCCKRHRRERNLGGQRLSDWHQLHVDTFDTLGVWHKENFTSSHKPRTTTNNSNTTPARNQNPRSYDPPL